MQKKKTDSLIPKKNGLSARNIIYLIIFRELKIGPKYMKELHDVVTSEPIKLKSKSYIYQAIQEMESFAWISCIETEGLKRTMAITNLGLMKLDDLIETYKSTIERLKKAADFFLYEIRGTRKNERLDWNLAENQLFNRLTNVRHLARYLFLTILNDPQHSAETVIDIYELIKSRYGWQCGEGYIYELAHEMEEPTKAWVEGKWNSSRRHHYVYRITEAGREAISREAEITASYLRALQEYSQNLFRLFPD